MPSFMNARPLALFTCKLKPTFSPAKTTNTTAIFTAAAEAATAATAVTAVTTTTSSIHPGKSHFMHLLRSSKTTQQLHQIHAQILVRDLSFSSLITTQLISASSLRKSIDYALSIFNRYDDKNLFVFNALIRGLVSNSRFKDALLHFILMLRSSIRPDHLTYPFVLKSVSGLSFKRLGRAAHGMVIKFGVQFDLFVRISLVDMYVKVATLGFAMKVFDETPQRFDCESTLLWNVLINGSCKFGNMKKAMELFEAMPERNSGSWTSLINGFLGKGDLDGAWELFERMPDKDVVSWTAVINGFSQNGEHAKAVSIFSRMLEEGVRPNEFTVVTALSACAKIGARQAGTKIHRYLIENDFQLNTAVGTALVNMYMKCGDVESASQVFGETKKKDIRTWSAMIWGWAVHARSAEAVQCFKQMMFAGIKPDEAIFLAILTACTYSGQVNLGLNFFDSMSLDYSIDPTMKHYALIVDLLGRTGYLDEALEFIEDMPVDPDYSIWGVLFCTSRFHKNTDMALFALQRLLDIEPSDPGSYVFFSNIYAAVDRWKDVKRLGVLMRSRAVDKDRRCSYIELNGQVYTFITGDDSLEGANEIDQKLAEIIAGAKDLGFMPATDRVLHTIEEEEKEEAVGSHSEKLALALGLIHTQPGMTIRIVKNLRVCIDCHALFKYASKLSQREIVLRDRKRFHHFKGGVCSCGDYW